MAGARRRVWVFVLAVVAATLGAIAFLVSYAEGEPEWVPLVIAFAMVGLAVSELRKPPAS